MPGNDREKNLMASTDVSSEPAVLEVRKITVRFEGLEAISRLSFAIASGRIVSIIGPNGAGKTTLLNAITGVYSLHDGEIRFQGKPISGLKPFQIAALGITRSFQQVQLFVNMTVLENVMVGMHPLTSSGFLKGMLRLPSERKEEAWITARSQEILKEFGLLEKADALAGHISILDQRRLEIARALAGQPKILLLDEPAAGLTIREMEAMGDLILRLREKGQTIILVEHNMRLVMAISDHLIVLHHGVKIGEGRPEEVQKNRQVIDAYLGA